MNSDQDSGSLPASCNTTLARENVTSRKCFWDGSDPKRYDSWAEMALKKRSAAERMGLGGTGVGSHPERADPKSVPACASRGKVVLTRDSSDLAQTKASVPKRTGAPGASGLVDEAIGVVTVVTRALPLPGAPTVVVCY